MNNKNMELSDEDVEALKSDGKYALIRLIDEYNSQLEEGYEQTSTQETS